MASKDYFQGKIAVVTGGASGLGRMLCHALASRGATVIVTDINHEGAELVSADINKQGGEARAALLDVSDEEAVTTLVNDTYDRYGRIDFMFNNAGYGIAGEVRDMSISHWRDIVDVNLMGVVYGTMAAYRCMVQQGYGHIVNISSMTGLIGLPFAAPYAMTKAGVLRLSTSLRSEAKPLGVRVSAICPGFIDTSLFENTTLVNVRQEAAGDIPFTPMPVDKAVQIILRDVARNKPISVFPFHARLLYTLSRIDHRLMEMLLAPSIKAFTQKRIEKD